MRARRHALVLIATVALTVIVTALLNSWVNPLRLTGSPWTSEDFDAFREIGEHNARSSKAGLARSRTWNAVALGSSRVNLAIDPYHPLWDGTKVLNLGLSSGTLPESAHALHYVLAHQDLETVLLAVDTGDLTSPETTLAHTDFLQSPLAPDHQTLERELRYWTGFSTLSDSLETMKRKRTATPAKHSARGNYSDPKPRPFQAKRILNGYIPRALAMINRRGDRPVIDPSKSSALTSILATCRERNIRLIVFIPPNYGLFAATFFVANDVDPTFSLDRRHLVDAVRRSNSIDLPGPLVELWDFHDFHPINTEPLPPLDQKDAKLRWFIDATHANPALGGIMLTRMLGGAPDLADASDYGTRLTEKNLNHHLEAIRNGYESYAAEQAQDFKLLRDAIHEAE